MKILHLLQSSHFSGAENVVCQIIAMMKNENNIQMMYCSRDGQIREALRERNIEFYPIDRMSVSEIKRVIKICKPDIIHAHDMHASFKAALCCGSIALICHIHNNNFNSRNFSLKTFFFKYAANKAKHIIWVSDTSFSSFYYRDKYINKSIVLYNIINIDKIYEKLNKDESSYDYDIVYLGRLSEPKNPIRLLRVFEQIIKKRPHTKLAIVGSGELEKQVKEVASKMNFNGNLYFLGFKSNPYKILADAKLMILTSLWEGTPMCSLEAMSLGIPIVSTPTDGLSKVVKNGVTGYLSNDDTEIVNYCCDLLDNEKIRNSMSVAAKKRAVELMDLQKYKDTIKRLYENAL